LLYVAGHATLAVGGYAGATGALDFARLAAYAGLLLISVGAGGIKPCVSANVGDQFTSKNAHLIERIFQIFYFTINFGSFFATLLIPVFYKNYGAEVAFGIPGFLMAVAAIIFWVGRKRFVHISPQPGGALGRLDFLASSLMMMPLLFTIYVLLQESEPIVGAITQHGWSTFGPALKEVVIHYWWALAISVIAFGVGVFIAQLRQRRKADVGFLALLMYCLKHRQERLAGEDFWAPARQRFGAEAAEGPVHLG
jgi:dipeptide/tripeptide permease